MENETGISMSEEFATLDFNSSRLEKRFVRTMETLAGQINMVLQRESCRSKGRISNVG